MSFIINSFRFVSAALGAGFTTVNKNADVTLSNADRTAFFASTSGTKRVYGATSHSSGKHYFEIIVDSVSAGGTYNPALGISGATIDNSNLGTAATDYGYLSNGQKRGAAAAAAAFGSSFTAGDVIGVAADLTAGNIWFAKNNVWQASGDPASGASPAFTGLSGSKRPCAMAAGSISVQTTIRTGSDAIAYTPPSGFSPWG